jgi:FixJ family two-component response regulator
MVGPLFRNLDWQDLYAELPRREKAIITLMVQGKSGSAIARKLKVTVSAIQTGKRHLAKAIVEFMGPDILAQVRKLPRWKDSLDATRERQACRYERNH